MPDPEKFDLNKLPLIRSEEAIIGGEDEIGEDEEITEENKYDGSEELRDLPQEVKNWAVEKFLSPDAKKRFYEFMKKKKINEAQENIDKNSSD